MIKSSTIEIYNDISSFDKKIRTSVLIGTFDGVHKGHQKVLNEFIELSKKEKTESVLITFSPHPRELILNNKVDFKLINTIEERISKLKQQNIDNLIIHSFSLEFSQLGYKEFVLNFLYKKVNMRQLVIGYDNRFGKNREGHFEKLKELSEKYNFKLNKLEALKENKTFISSTKIRNAILEGNIELANNFLGRKFCIKGKVIYGNKLGAKIGFPTANLKIEKNKITPKDGVYSVDIKINRSIYVGIMNIGFKPTVEKINKTQSIEIHIFDFQKNIYGEYIEVFVNNRVRDEQEFRSIEELKSQIKKDILMIKNKNNE